MKRIKEMTWMEIVDAITDKVIVVVSFFFKIIFCIFIGIVDSETENKQEDGDSVTGQPGSHPLDYWNDQV